MRTKKNSGFWKIHQNCAICQHKGKIYRDKIRDKEKVKELVTEIECFPDPKCCCCVCQGRFCLMDHPGHWHKSKDKPEITQHPTVGQ